MIHDSRFVCRESQRLPSRVKAVGGLGQVLLTSTGTKGALVSECEFSLVPVERHQPTKCCFCTRRPPS